MQQSRAAEWDHVLLVKTSAGKVFKVIYGAFSFLDNITTDDLFYSSRSQKNSLK